MIMISLKEHFPNKEFAVSDEKYLYLYATQMGTHEA